MIRLQTARLCLTRFTNACNLSILLVRPANLFTAFFSCVLESLGFKQKMTHVLCVCLVETMAIADFALPAFSTHRYMGCIEWARLSVIIRLAVVGMSVWMDGSGSFGCRDKFC